MGVIIYGKANSFLIDYHCYNQNQLTSNLQQKRHHALSQHCLLCRHLHNEILKTVKLVKDDVVSNPEETEQDEASETSLDEDLSDDEGREWSELLEYEGEAGEFNIDDKE